LLAGCATTTNDAGVRLYKKPDLSKVVVGTPISKVAALRNPIHREVMTKGNLKGAEVWTYEWDAPNDDVNNMMFTSIAVKDGVILGWYEDTVDKWRKNPKAHKDAKLASAWQDAAGYMAQAHQYQQMANAFSAMGSMYPSTTSSYPLRQANEAAMFAAITAPSSQPTRTQRGTMLTSPQGNYLGSISPTGMMTDARGNYRGSADRLGNISGAQGQYLGNVSRSGAMTDSRGNYLGTVSPGGAVGDSQGRFRGTISGGSVVDTQGRAVMHYSE
jgi:hypothetical protein